MIGHAPFTGTLVMARAHLRSRWKSLLLWTVLLMALVLATVSSIKGLYPTLEARLAYEASMSAAPASAAFNGRGYDLSTLGGIAAFEVGFMGLLALPIVMSHLAIRLTRSEEDAGRTELIRAGRVGRLAPMTAAAVVLLEAVALFVVATASGMTAIGYAAGGSWTYSLGLGLFGLAYGALALVAAELSSESRTAYGLTMLAVLVTFLVRAVVDGRSWSTTWLSPMGWLAEIRPWGATRWWPLIALGVLVAVALAAAVLLTLRRDLGGGLIGAARGPATARRGLGTPLGLAWRFTRGAFWGWLGGLVVWGVAIGSLSSEMTDLVAANPAITEALGVDRPEQLITVMAMLIAAIGTASLAVQGIGRLSREEQAGRLALPLSTGIGRARVWGTWVVLVAVQTTVVLLASSLSVGVTTALVTEKGDSVRSSLEAGLALTPAVVFILAVAAMLHALAPSSTSLAWLLVGWAAVVGILAEALQLAGWARDLSPLYVVGNVPIGPADGTAIAVLVGIALALVVGGLWRFSRRDLVAG
ncbi:ABC transporter permease [Blastococcus sp. Marseille-P5729]|uniref:ABC transporter permease n=1 Tax=Blastococcus sp. Marseille-P5729 TaxID=2086582 RepID=UPI000D0F4FBC|nr:ABC transporter [Blastococcus sp. Marseille-P5729]